ncbi:tetratricopeptide repeat protein [Nereida sp. MMG024]|nr:tetratricopeptide repeat protein [Nereida sp. MMG025]
MDKRPVSLKQQADKLHVDGDLDAARPLYIKYLALNPQDAGAWTNYGILLRKSKLYDAAVLAQRRAYALAKDDGVMNNNFANVLSDIGCNEEAIALREALLAIQPDSPEQIALIGRALRIDGKLDEARARLETAITQYPDDAELRMQLAFTELTAGNYARGFRLYQARWEQSDIRAPKVPKPRWNGDDLTGKTILVFSEQGFGDCILFTRFMPWLQSLGAKVILHAKPPIASLVSQAHGVDQIISDLSDLPAFDVWTSMMDVPMFAFEAGADIPAPTKLTLPDHAVTRAKIATKNHQDAFKIAVVWSGSATYKGNDFRKFDHREILRLAAIDGVQCFSLYKGPFLDDFRTDGTAAFAIDLGSTDHDFADSAAVMAEMDLVITMDTAIAHIAGSLDLPVWNLLHWDGFWLYGPDGDRTPWYPCMRLIRQPKPRDWDSVFDVVTRDLAPLVAAKKG